MSGRATILLGLLLCGACAARQSGPFADPRTATYAPALGVDLDAARTISGGMFVQDVREGTGTRASPGSRVRIHYTVWLPDGTEVESTRGVEPLTVELSERSTIFGDGIVGMRTGGLRTLVVPPERAYGRDGVPGLIPPNSTLVFSVELIEVVPRWEDPDAQASQ